MRSVITIGCVLTEPRRTRSQITAKAAPFRVHETLGGLLFGPLYSRL